MTPGDRIRLEMNARGWTQRELATVLGKTLAAVNEILQGKRSVTPEMAVALEGALGINAAEWLNLDANYRLSQIKVDTADVSRRAKLFERAPVLDMQKRGWIDQTDDVGELEAQILRFYDAESLDRLPQVAAAFRRSADEKPLTPAHRAWCARARNLARAVSAVPFDGAAFDKGVKKLRRLVGWPEATSKVSRILAEMGIRFVVVEPLPSTKIDGAAFRLDEASPVIAMSLRYDRIDSFWHTLGHELSHVRHGDEAVLDSEIVGEDRKADAGRNPVERRADEEAAATWIDPEEMNSFILRVSPLYSKAKINQFANRLVVHPGVIVGQLQHRGQIGYQAMRDTLVKVRDHVTSEAITDGWGHVIGR